MEVRREIERAIGSDLAIGAVYSTLDRVEARCLLRCAPSAVGSSRQRFFETMLDQCDTRY
jgi:hypothetical protein